MGVAACASGAIVNVVNNIPNAKKVGMFTEA